MRSEHEFMGLILGVAQDDARIRAVVMNGSRTDSHVTRDKYQDYDIVYVVTETAPFIADKLWLDEFGPRIIMQEPDKIEMDLGKTTNFARRYAYLMLFTDGNRLDLTLSPLSAILPEVGTDTLTTILLDKDCSLPPLPDSSDRGYYVRMPTQLHYEACCNEFWWCLQNVGKGLVRDEMPYAKQTMECIVRPMLDKMVDWSIGIDFEFNVNTGKMGKRFKKYLPSEQWETYLRTYSGCDARAVWEAVFAACSLFRDLATRVAERFGFQYPLAEDRAMSDYLEQLRKDPVFQLPLSSARCIDTFNNHCDQHLLW